MTAATVFSIANMTAMLMWILMVLLPKWKLTQFLMDHKIIPILLSVVYAIYIVSGLISGGSLDFGSLESVMRLFTKEAAVLAGWVHYLVFDLLVGMWMIDQNKKYEINQVLMAVCLLGTFMLGPIGFLIFTIIKPIKKSL